MTERIFTYLKAAAPTVNDDTGDGYFVGDMWLDETNDAIYQAIDISSGAAVWKQLSARELTLQFGELSGDPADSTTYYTGQSFGIARGTSAGRRNIQIPVTGTIVAIYGNVLVTGTLGSAETSTVSLRLNDTTDTTISSTVVASALNNQFNGTGLGVAVVPGNTVEIKWVTPAWATNPTAVVLSGTILIQL